MLKEQDLIVAAAILIREAQVRKVNTNKVLNAIEFARSILNGDEPDYHGNV